MEHGSTGLNQYPVLALCHSILFWRIRHSGTHSNPSTLQNILHMSFEGFKALRHIILSLQKENSTVT
ncbi:hypothetical protein T03_15520 [Trichinella britovi]|uniref:Uncharacterized protein n=1 Tax=Trichinella britovi TaxID=45882 RepID=A0A0V0Z0P1_TRIBR|nr:hypothetical protein T03_15520 [Trichinella britovi]